jgi:cob(I)alamin adenosyltransferase
MSRSLLIVLTGPGKGKTTSALGQVLRAAGHGMRSCVIQFIKGTPTGEARAAERFGDLIEWHITGCGFTWKSKDLQKDIEAARKGWALAREKIASGEFRLVVLDELTCLTKYRMVPVEEIVRTLRDRPEDLHVVVTGRDAPPELIEAADLVTEMHLVKHPYESGTKAQPGIEF